MYPSRDLIEFRIKNMQLLQYFAMMLIQIMHLLFSSNMKYLILGYK